MEISEPTITKLALDLGAKRQQIYPVIKGLIDNGLIGAKERYNRYIALNSPSKLITKLRDKEIRFRRLIDD